MNHHPEIPQAGLLTRAWVKNYLSISNSTLHQWITDGRLPAPVKIGPRAVRFRASDIAAFVAKPAVGTLASSDAKRP